MVKNPDIFNSISSQPSWAAPKSAFGILSLELLGLLFWTKSNMSITHIYRIHHQHYNIYYIGSYLSPINQWIYYYYKIKYEILIVHALSWIDRLYPISKILKIVGLDMIYHKYIYTHTCKYIYIHTCELCADEIDTYLLYIYIYIPSTTNIYNIINILYRIIFITHKYVQVNYLYI